MTDLPTLADPDRDPWLWLEEVEGERATGWADAQTAATLARFGGARYDADRETLRLLLDRPDNLPVPTRRGGLLFNFWRDGAHPRGLWRRTTLASYRSAAPEWEILLDIDALATDEGEDWIWQGASTLHPDHRRAIVSLSRGGSDASVLREFDLVGRRFIVGGFTLPEAKGGVDWLDGETLLLSSAFGGATASGYARTVRLWSRGTDPAKATVLIEVPHESMGAGGGYDREEDRLVFTDQTGFFDSTMWLGDRNGPAERMQWPTDASARWSRGWLALRPRTAWTLGDATHAPDSVLVIRLADWLAGSREVRVAFTPQPRRALQGMFWLDGRLLLSILDELRPVFVLLTPGGWEERTIEGLPQVGTASAWPFDAEAEESDGSLLAVVQDPVTPPTLLLVPPDLSAPAVLKQAPAAFDATGLVVTRHEAVSSDGERIPYVQTGPATQDGNAPVHLSGYGGFRLSRLPTYGVATGKLWLERGGTAVVANLRGGGEFGTRWHEAGRREGKRLSHDDFAAVAADLVQRGVTRPARIAAEGRSNGGLLIANMLTRYPGRFGALFCTIPLIDMRRYSKLLAGASWIAEYGDPDVAADWAFLGPMSAYHAAEPGRPYPPILLATARRDDRVHPGHARKMAAKLLSMGYDASFYEPAAGGHGYGKDNAEVAGFVALGFEFLRRSIGWQS
ncbi:prolyl oligopeptidase family serine peptidase [Lichenicoccus roseus]|uniref:S9 family peptidase n=1 Tax=Lichenicoccus roseus TaxID=2683649 RepID=A0A5R9J878_9PROT|nr:prolyl oligopeptidase family serine peptidase [Lichenicoccus roseus]TLU73179.1 S9 family peptidase [Lichenicoccus roseus]